MATTKIVFSIKKTCVVAKLTFEAIFLAPACRFKMSRHPFPTRGGGDPSRLDGASGEDRLVVVQTAAGDRIASDLI